MFAVCGGTWSDLISSTVTGRGWLVLTLDYRRNDVVRSVTARQRRGVFLRSHVTVCRVVYLHCFLLQMRVRHAPRRNRGLQHLLHGRTSHSTRTNVRRRTRPGTALTEQRALPSKLAIPSYTIASKCPQNIIFPTYSFMRLRLCIIHRIHEWSDIWWPFICFPTFKCTHQFVERFVWILQDEKCGDLYYWLFTTLTFSSRAFVVRLRFNFWQYVVDFCSSNMSLFVML